MEQTSITLTVYFDGQFYVGLFERIAHKKLSVARYVFGAEPKDMDVYEVVLHKLVYLKFSPTVEVEQKNVTKKNPKVMQRKVKAVLSESGIGTKAQQAVKAQLEQRKIVSKALSKEKREEAQTIKFEKRQLKKKEKHKGH